MGVGLSYLLPLIYYLIMETNYSDLVKTIYKSYSSICKYWLWIVIVAELLICGTSIWYLVENWNTAVSVILLGVIVLSVLSGILIIKIKRMMLTESRPVNIWSLDKKLDILTDLIKDRMLLDGLKEYDLSNIRDEDNVVLINTTFNSIKDEDLHKIAEVILRKGGYVRYNK